METVGNPQKAPAGKENPPCTGGGSVVVLKRLDPTSADETFSVRVANPDRNAPTLGCPQADPSSCQSDCTLLLLALFLSSFRASEPQDGTDRARIAAATVFTSV